MVETLPNQPTTTTPFCLRVSHPRGGNQCGCDEGVSTHSVSHAHFSGFPAVLTWPLVSLVCVQYSQVFYPCILSMCEHTRMAQGVCSAHAISPHLNFSLLVFHPPSSLFPHGHLDTSFQTWNGRTQIGKPTGRKLHHHQQWWQHEHQDTQWRDLNW